MTSDLDINITVNNANPFAGHNVVFTLSGQNYGPHSDTNVNVQALLPSGYIYVSHVTTNGTYNSGTGVWNVGNHPIAQSILLTITATAVFLGIHSFTVTIAGDNNDPNPSNNTSTTTTTVHSPFIGGGSPDIQLDAYIRGNKSKLIIIGKHFTIKNDSVIGNNGNFIVTDIQYDVLTNLTRIRYINNSGSTENPATGTLKIVV